MKFSPRQNTSFLRIKLLSYCRIVFFAHQGFGAPLSGTRLCINPFSIILYVENNMRLAYFRAELILKVSIWRKLGNIIRVEMLNDVGNIDNGKISTERFE